MWFRRRLLVALLIGGVFVAVSPRRASAVEPPTASLRAGAGRAEVVFPQFPVDGFVGQHDPLVARVLLLDDGHLRLGIMVIDLTSISDDLIASCKAIVTAVAGLEADHLIVCASHGFSAPHVFGADHAPAGTDAAGNTAARKAFEAAVRAAATQAVATWQPVKIGYGSGTSRVNVSRDVATAHGWWLGANDAGFSDHALGVLRLDRADGRPLAVLLNFAVQSSIMDASQAAAGGRLISADLAGAATHRVETHFGADTVALFLVGAAGDQAPYLQAARHVVDADGVDHRVDLHETGFTLVDLLGERLGDEAARVADAIATGPASGLDLHRERVDAVAQTFSPRTAPTGPVTTFVYQTGGKVSVPVVLMRLGDLALVGVQPELSACVGAAIKTGSPYPHTFVATMVDGAAKYLPDTASYDRFTYEARSSPFARGSAETVTAAVIERLKAMQSSETQSQSAR